MHVILLDFLSSRNTKFYSYYTLHTQVKKIMCKRFLNLCSIRGAAIVATALMAWQGADAAKISLAEAQTLAADFLRQGNSNSAVSAKALPLVYTGGSAADPLYYIFNAADGKGFVMISADDSTDPILGYSLENAFIPQAMPAAMQWMLSGIAQDIVEAPTLQSPLSLGERRSRVRRAAVMEPKSLQTPPYSQESPFNNAIPGRPLVGCVGTAMASIMKYYEWPAQGSGSFGGVSFSTPYDWSNILSSNYRSGYTAAQADAVALLSYHASKSIDTQYSLSGSSAYEQRVPLALTNYFGYDPGASYKRRSDVASTEEWEAMIRAEIAEGRPVIYCGQDVSAGHAFICDGYDANGMLHFNWGWGGAANGYFRTTALNPTVSRQHNYNNFNTIIFNIKPYRGNARWSVIHVTADGDQAGMGSDMADLNARKTFDVRVGNLKNLSYDTFSGKIAVALFDAQGNFKALLSPASSLSMRPMASLTEERGVNYCNFNACRLPSDISAEQGDEVRIATSADNGATWNPVGGELYTASSLDAMRAAPEYFPITLPASVEGASIKGDAQVIREMDYTFTVALANPATDVVAVKANGVILSPISANTYCIPNVTKAQNVTVIVQKAADVVAKRSIYVKEPGTLSTLLSDAESAGVKDLTLFGQIDARDFKYIRTKLRLSRIDISSAYICAYDYDQACALPFQAFSECGTLREVVLPKNLTRINNGAFRYTGIQSIVIPASVSKYEYNVFVGCGALRHIWVGRQNAEFINWCVLSGTNKAAMTLHCPNQTAVNNYRAKDNWKEIGNIIVDPIQESNDVAFAISENQNVEVECNLTSGQRYEKNTRANFTVKNLSSLDRRMDVYANNNKLTPNADGSYTTDLTANTLIHFDFVAPIVTVKENQFWSIQGVEGSLGMLSEVVNVLRGQEFKVQVNNLNVPSGTSAQYWAMALCDRAGDIKEFISPVVMSSFQTGNANKFTVTCCVRESDIREGNQVRLVSSFTKKNWDLVPATGDARAAVQALNNQNPVYAVTVSQSCEADSPEAAVAGPAGSSVTHGFDYDLRLTAPSASHRIDVTINGELKASKAQVYLYKFRASRDENIQVRVYPFIEIDEADIVVTESDRLVDINDVYGSISRRLAAIRNSNGTVKSKIKITGPMDNEDFDLIRHKDFRSAVKYLDLSEVYILKSRKNATDLANVLPKYAFGSASENDEAAFVEIKLPATINRIGQASFNHCANIKELELPLNIRGGSGGYNPTNANSGGGLDTQCFAGCTGLETLYVYNAPVNGLVNHIKAATTSSDISLGLKNHGKITVVVRPEYYNVYTTPQQELFMTSIKSQNSWQKNGFNIVAEYPVYKLNYNPTHAFVSDKAFNADRAVNFLYDNVEKDTQTLSNLYVSSLCQHDAKPEASAAYDATRTRDMVRVYDNGTLLPESAINADGSIAVTYHNPKNHSNYTSGLTGNHDIKVVHLNHVKFNLPSPLFTLDFTEGVRNNTATLGQQATRFEIDDRSNPLTPTLKYVLEGDMVSFRVDIQEDGTSTQKLEARARIGEAVLTPNSDGVFSIPMEGENLEIELFGVPVAGESLNADEFNSIDVNEAAASTTTLALTGEISEEILNTVKEEFKALEVVDLSEMTSAVPASMFEGNETLTSVALPNNATVIEANTFADCPKLNSVAIPESVAVIGEGAFKNCTSLTSLTMTGIEAIGANAFQGCTSLTSITINAAKGDAPLRARRIGAAFSQDAFAGLNPNCLIILDEGVDAPLTPANYIATSAADVESDANGEVTSSRVRVYAAASDIRFEAGYALDIENPFTVADTHTVSLKASAHSANGDEAWTPLLVPFDVQNVTLPSSGETLLPSTAKEQDTKAGYYQAVAPRNDRDASQAADFGMMARNSRIKANASYLFRIASSAQDVTFSAANLTVPATPQSIATEGETMTLAGSYKPVELPAADLYTLGTERLASGWAFTPAYTGNLDADLEESIATPTHTLPAYSVYAVSAERQPYLTIHLDEGSVETGVNTISPDTDIQVSVQQGVITILAADSRTIDIHSADGARTATVTLHKGLNTLPSLPRGIYMIAGRKIRL